MPGRGRPPQGRNRAAIEATIVAMERSGRLEEIDSTQIAIAQALADAVDSDPTNASLWWEYRGAEQALRENDDPSSDEFTQILAALSAEVGDTETP